MPDSTREVLHARRIEKGAKSRGPEVGGLWDQDILWKRRQWARREHFNLPNERVI